MAPLRRYLRITKYSVLEVRIYLEKPSDAPWLLRDQILPRIFAEIRPKVLPKLREENENSKKKGSKKKKKGIKDVITQDDFEVVLFLTDSYTRHSLITKQKHFSKKPAIKSTGSKMTEWLGSTTDNAIDVDDAVPGLLQEEEDDDETPNLNDVPELETNKVQNTAGTNDALSVSSDEEEAFMTQRAAPRRGKKRPIEEPEEAEEEPDDKKKLGLDTSYDGFSLYGKILCLIVKRKGQKKATIADAPAGGSEMMESWISTQANQQADLDDDA